MCPMGPFKFGARFPKFVFIQPLDPMQQLQKLFQWFQIFNTELVLQI